MFLMMDPGDLFFGMNEGTSSVGVVLETYDDTMTGVDWTDLSGTGGDITTKFNGTQLGITPSPLHGANTTATPSSGKFTMTVRCQANSETHFLGMNILANTAARKFSNYAASERNSLEGDQCCIVFVNLNKTGPLSGVSGDLIEIFQFEHTGGGQSYTQKATYAGVSEADNTSHKVDIHVDLNGGNPNISVDFDDVEVISSTSMGAGTYSYGSNFLVYTDGPGAGTTASSTNIVTEFSWDETA